MSTTTNYTVTDPGNAKKTAEGFIIPGGEA